MPNAFQQQMADMLFGKTGGGCCVRCKKVDADSDFRDEVSRREFAITRLCQDCQDYVFGEPEE